MIVLLFALTVTAAPQHLDFEDDHVEGDIVTPDAPIVDAAKRPKRESLIHLRTSFVPEIVRSANQL